MAGKRHDQGRVCGCDRPDGSCAGLAVRRLSQDRVRELAEEIWAASAGLLVPARPALDPRSSRPGASARAAYLRRREQERAVWRPGRAWRWWTGGGAALTVGLVVGATLGERLGCVGDGRGGGAGLVAAALSPLAPGRAVAPAGRAAAPHRRAAAAAGAGGLPGLARPHPAGMAGHPGASGGRPDRGVGGRVLAAPAAATWRRRPTRDPAGPARADRGPRRGPHGLDGLDRVPVRALLCVHGPWPASPRSFPGGLRTAGPRQLAKLIRSEPPLAADQLQQATTGALHLLRPAT